MNPVRRVLSRFKYSVPGRKIRLAKAFAWRPVLRKLAYPRRKLSFYFLSTGRVGTRFFSHVLDTATNARVFHQPMPVLFEEQHDVVRTYFTDREAFARLDIRDFPLLEEKILKQSRMPVEVYGDTLNQMFAFGYLLYRHLGPERLRLIHLIRDPVTCCRSILKVERDDHGHGRFREIRSPEFVTGKTPAEKAANIWLGINRMIRNQFELIDDPRVCKVVRLEDNSPETARELFDFLGLESFEEEKIRPLFQDRSHSVRHSHVKKVTHNPDATPEELETVRRMTREFAGLYGYDD